MKSTYIHEYLFTHVPIISENFYNNFPYLYSWLYRLIPVLFLTWIFISVIPWFANLAHRQERKYLKKREEENIDYEEGIAGYKLKHSTNQDALLGKEENDAKRKKALLDLITENKTRDSKIKVN
jgi:hypothetical protein